MSEEDKQRGYELYTEYNVAGLVGHCLEEEKENKKLKQELQQKENIIKELNNTIKEMQEDIDILTSDDDNDSVWNERENM